MTQVPRHQCLIYRGPSTRYLTMLAAIIRQKLEHHYRCLYLNNPAMVELMRLSLESMGVNVAHEIEDTSLVLSSSRDHLAGGKTFEVDRMIGMLEETLQRALLDGYAGLWATGDMTWEFGPARDFSKLVEYEWRLEEFLRSQPKIGGVCQYQADSLPREVMQHGLCVHRGLFINETVSLINPVYLPPEAFPSLTSRQEEVDSVLERLCAAELSN
jgi:MEDS: MEthanogen/methylotroph, DcmR Sensory domain